MIVLYTGRRGAGKTLSLTKDAYTFYLEGYEIYSNMKFEFPHIFITNEEILDIAKKGTKYYQVHNAVLIIDEIQILIDSRRSVKKGNVDFSYFVQQIRKRNIILLCTTQFSGTVDLRLRQHVDIIARPRYDKQLQVCEVMYVDITVEDTFDTFYEPKVVSVIYDAKEVFELYNTLNIIENKEVEVKKKD